MLFIDSGLSLPKTDLYLLVEWLNSEDAMVDTLPARDVIPPEGLDILDVKTGDRCQASYKSRYYSVKVAAVGMSIL